MGAQLEAGVDRERQVRPDVAIGALQRGAAGLADVLRRRELAPAGEQVVGRALHSGEALGGVAEADDVRRRGLVGVDAAAGAVRVRVGERPAGAVEQRSAEEVVRGVVGADVVPLHVGDEAPVREPEQLPARLVGEGRGGGGAEEQREEHQPDAVADAVGGEVEAGAQDERDGGGAEGPAQEREDGQHARRREEVRERFEHGSVRCGAILPERPGAFQRTGCFGGSSRAASLPATRTSRGRCRRTSSATRSRSAC